MADPGAGSWTPINMFAMLRKLINDGAPILTNAGSPSSGTSGTYAGQAGTGALLIDITNAVLYMNTNTLASPTWTQISVGGAGSITTAQLAAGAVTAAKIAANAVGSGQLALNTLQIATGQISSTNITGTSAGQLGNSNGVVLVAAAPSKSVNRLIGATIAMDFATAAYTGGGNTTINISGGGAALTGLVNTTTFIQTASDVIIDLVPLAATNLNYGTGANGLALVTSVAPTNPGTAAGVINWQVAYEQIAGLID